MGLFGALLVFFTYLQTVAVAAATTEVIHVGLSEPDVTAAFILGIVLIELLWNDEYGRRD